MTVQFLKFLLIGGVNTVFGYAVFAGLILAGVPPVPALVATYVVGVCFNFWTTRKFVFGQKGFSALGRFVAAYVVIYFFNLAVFKGWEVAGAGPLWGQALSIPIVAVFSFLLFKLHVFKDGHGA
jgi:putative flippase GtrA